MTVPSSASLQVLIQRIDQLLPQTQCRRCGYDDCHDYASALARGETDINRCPPGQDETIVNLSQLLKRPVLPLADDLAPMPARQVVRIQAENCIGCTKCILACPVDAIVGAPKFLHQVLADRCTGCELCLPPCPTDCIEVLTLDTPWQDIDAIHGRQHHQRRNQRLEAERQRNNRPAPHTHRPSLATTAASPTGTAGIQPAMAKAPGNNTSLPAHSTPPSPRQHERDPLVALAATDEKARRLAAIRERLSSAGRQPQAAPDAPTDAAATRPAHPTGVAHPSPVPPAGQAGEAHERNPLVALASADEKARRLAAIRARLGQQKAAANTPSKNHRP